ncbi:MAG: DDE-type integrase/transposase/recombinase [Dermatophilaceae bacterium]
MKVARPVRRAGQGNPPSRKVGRAPWSDPYTYLRTWQGWLYLATVIDAHSRRVIGWAIDEHMRADLVQDALVMAITLRGDLPAKVVFHSDRGTQGLGPDHCVRRSQRADPIYGIHRHLPGTTPWPNRSSQR